MWPDRVQKCIVTSIWTIGIYSGFCLPVDVLGVDVLGVEFRN